MMEIKCDKSEAKKVIVQVNGETIFNGEDKKYHCPACGGDKIVFLNDTHGIKYNGCLNCGCWWTSPKEAKEYIQKSESKARSLHRRAVFALCLSSGALILSLITFVVKLLLK